MGAIEAAVRDRVTQSEYARMRGISRQRVNTLRKAGRLSLDADGLVVVSATDRALGRSLDRSRGNRDAPGAQVPEQAKHEQASDTGYWGFKAQREAAEAELAGLKLRKTRGELVDAAEVARSRRETAATVASALLQIPGRLAPVIAPGDPQVAEKALRDEIERVLGELADDLEDHEPRGGSEQGGAPGAAHAARRREPRAQ